MTTKEMTSLPLQPLPSVHNPIQSTQVIIVSHQRSFLGAVICEVKLEIIELKIAGVKFKRPYIKRYCWAHHVYIDNHFASAWVMTCFNY